MIVYLLKIIIRSESIAFSLYSDSQPAFTCSTLTIETLEQDVKYVQS